MQPLKPIPEMLIKTRVTRFRAHSLVWADTEFAGTQTHTEDDAENRRKILEFYSVGISTTPSLQPLEFLPDTEIDASAERYGGYGLARNGGGVRCVNLGDIQIKGIGVNQLIGADVLEGYTSGTLNIAEGITEVIFSRLLNRVFPLGAVKTCGLIATHPTIATYKNADVKKYADGVPCWGALLLRETQWSAADEVFLSHSPGSHPLEIGDPLGFVDGCTDTAFVQDSCDFRPMVKAVAATAGAIARDLTGVATAASA